MAEIRVKRETGAAWIWLIPAAFLIALVWWWLAASRENDDGVFAEADAGAVLSTPATPVASGRPITAATPDRASGPITDLPVILDVSNSDGLVGREVRLQGVSVKEMVGDAAFWIGPTANRRLFVVLDEVIPAPPPRAEGRINVEAGQNIDLRGILRSAADLPAGDVLDAEGRAVLAEQQVYLWAETASRRSAG